ncbi:sulfotransferase [Neobacillus mesonae]|uniref:sulfotransferase family protein n=1 Tax=Neobacillus mesonae TaxID=1193713 RepID=UPI002E1AD4A9|nr:sulfotransferase [Neobacillus mesonae]
MNKKVIESFKGPVVIGGVGGSGTRVAAEILKELGYYLGPLNKSNDNIQFAKLFGNPEWFIKSDKTNKKAIFKQLKMFQSGMVKKLKPHQSNYLGWGWKNPATHLYMAYLAKTYPSMKYIHVIRNGLEMAYSRNQNQLLKWGSLFQIKRKKEADPRTCLQYWYRANKRAIRVGKELLGHNFYLLNFNQLCSNPKVELDRLIKFLELDSKTINQDLLTKIVIPPVSLKRYKKHDLGIFKEEDLELVRKLGFEIGC